MQVTEAVLQTEAAPQEQPAQRPASDVPPAAAMLLSPQLQAAWMEVAQAVLADPGAVWQEEEARFRRKYAVEIAAVEEASRQRLVLRRPGQPGFPAQLVAPQTPELPVAPNTADFCAARTALQAESTRAVQEAAANNEPSEAALTRWEAANKSRLTQHREMASRLREYPFNHPAVQPQP